MKTRPMNDYSNWDLIDELVQLHEMSARASSYAMSSTDVNHFNHCELEIEVNAFRDDLNEAVFKFKSGLRAKAFKVQKEMLLRGMIK